MVQHGGLWCTRMCLDLQMVGYHGVLHCGWGVTKIFSSLPSAGGEVAGGTENMWTLVVEIYSALRKHQISPHHHHHSILHQIIGNIKFY